MDQKNPAISSRKSTRWLVQLALLAASAGAIPPSAHAEVRVTEQANSIRLETQNAALSDVLTALGATYTLPKGGMTEAERPFNGTYTGTARELIFRVLDGYDFIVSRSNGKFDVVIYGVSGKTPNAAPVAAPAPNAAPANVTASTPAPVASTATRQSTVAGSVSSGGSGKPAHPTGRKSVPDLLGTAALSQTQAPATPKDAVVPKPDMAALTQGAVSSLKGLVAALKTASIK
jgi:hypothetical protein